MQLAPVPAGNYDLNLIYFAQIPPLTESNPTNAILTQYYDLYLYATLVETVPFMRNAAALQLWTEYYNAALADIKRGETKARFGKQIQISAPRRV